MKKTQNQKIQSSEVFKRKKRTILCRLLRKNLRRSVPLYKRLWHRRATPRWCWEGTDRRNRGLRVSRRANQRTWDHARTWEKGNSDEAFPPTASSLMTELFGTRELSFSFSGERPRRTRLSSDRVIVTLLFLIYISEMFWGVSINYIKLGDLFWNFVFFSKWQREGKEETLYKFWLDNRFQHTINFIYNIRVIINFIKRRLLTKLKSCRWRLVNKWTWWIFFCSLFRGGLFDKLTCCRSLTKIIVIREIYISSSPFWI